MAIGAVARIVLALALVRVRVRVLDVDDDDDDDDGATTAVVVGRCANNAPSYRTA
jgi:hypothetical protein